MATVQSLYGLTYCNCISTHNKLKHFVFSHVGVWRTCVRQCTHMREITGIILHGIEYKLWYLPPELAISYSLSHIFRLCYFTSVSTNRKQDLMKELTLSYNFGCLPCSLSDKDLSDHIRTREKTKCSQSSTKACCFTCGVVRGRNMGAKCQPLHIRAREPHFY